MKWLKKKLRNWLLESNYEEMDVYPVDTPSKITSRNELQSRGMNFTLYNGIGGYVVEIRTYNKKTDCHDTALHIISSDKDLGESLTHIMTYELLKS
jgi:hypothetical protein